MVLIVVGAAVRDARTQAAVHEPENTQHVLRSTPPSYRPPVVGCLRVRLADGSGAYWVQVTEDEYAAAAHRQPTLISLALRTGSETREMLSYRTSDHLVNLIAPEGNSVVVAVSETGSAFMVRAFRLSPQQVSLVLEQGARLPPEFTMGRMLLDVGRITRNGSPYPKRTEIWEWRDSSYVLVATVPFDRRYEGLAKIEHCGAASEQAGPAILGKSTR